VVVWVEVKMHLLKLEEMVDQVVADKVRTEQEVLVV
tara:strand:+ start:160 stop:267 length:108 start_codon:yes stop_codon:yes gene_type:complete